MPKYTQLLVLTLSFCVASVGVACGGPGESPGSGNDSPNSTNSSSQDGDFAMVEGFVVDENGDPVGGGTVFLDSGTQDRYFANTVGDSGYYRIEAVQEGSYVLEANALPDNAGTNGQSLELSPNETRFITIYEDEDVDVSPEVEWNRPDDDEFATLEGTVVDEDGEPVEGALASGLAVNDDTARMAATTNEDGEFFIGSIWPGTYEMRAEVGGGSEDDAGEMSFSPGSTESIDFELQESESACPEDETLVEYQGQEMCAESCNDDQDCLDDEECTSTYCVPEEL